MGMIWRGGGQWYWAALVLIVVWGPGYALRGAEIKLEVRNVAIPLAVLGDSDSESYAGQRGGTFASHTLQWTEVLGSLRGNHLDQGAWGSWGQFARLMRLQQVLGWPLLGRAPRKFDYQYNFAIGGAVCADLISGLRQAPFLADLIDTDRERWAQGVVVIRIGGNSFGKADNLDLLALDPGAAPVQHHVAVCLDQIHQAVALLREHQPGLRFVLVGVYDNTQWPDYFDRWRDSRSMHNIRAGLARFDGALRTWAEADPRIAFFDDRVWFQARWGGRDSKGQPDPRVVRLAGRWTVRNALGDSPDHAALLDGHAGAVWNALWAQSLLDLLNTQFGLHIPPLDEQELLQLLALDNQALRE
jgi:hypothetical protein